MKGKHLDFYEDCMETGKITGAHLVNGLCGCDEIDVELLREYFTPSPEELDDLYLYNFDKAYWGSGLALGTSIDDLCSSFTPLRQTIVLFMAAINGEL